MTHDEIIAALRSSNGQLERIVAGLDEGQMSRRRADGHWSVKEVIGHLRDASALFHYRISRISHEDNPLLPDADTDALVANGNYNAADAAALFAETARLDNQLAGLLAGLDEAGWQRSGTHATNGLITVEQIATYHVNHAQGHSTEISERLAGAKLTHEQMIAALHHNAGQLATLVAGLDEERLRQPATNGWSIKELVGHLYDASGQYAIRFRRIAGEHSPTLPGYDQEQMVRDGDYQNRELAPLLHEIASRDEQTAAFLSGLPATAWQRIGVHEERGPTTLAEIVLHYVEHEHEHLAEVAQLAGSPTN